MLCHTSRRIHSFVKLFSDITITGIFSFGAHNIFASLIANPKKAVRPCIPLLSFIIHKAKQRTTKFVSNLSLFGYLFTIYQCLQAMKFQDSINLSSMSQHLANFFPTSCSTITATNTGHQPISYPLPRFVNSQCCTSWTALPIKRIGMSRFVMLQVCSILVSYLISVRSSMMRYERDGRLRH